MTNKLALVVAVVLGALSILGIKAYVEKVRVSEELRVQKITVFVAAREMVEGSNFTEDDLETSEFPRDVLEQALQNTWVTDKQTIIGIRTKTKIKAGQILLTSHFERGMSKVLERPKFLASQRAVSIPMSKTGGLAGMLRPQDLVDLIISMNVTDVAGRSIQMTRTLFRGVQILACGSNLDPSMGLASYSTLTLALSPRDVNKLLFVISQGADIQCALTMPGAPEGTKYMPIIANTMYEEIMPSSAAAGEGDKGVHWPGKV